MTEDNMGRVVTFSQLPAHAIADGASRAAITQGETREMAADLIRIDPAFTNESFKRPNPCFGLNCLLAHTIAPDSVGTYQDRTVFLKLAR
jgi:hypothetical protein